MNFGDGEMGMSTHIVGFQPPDLKWDKMKGVYVACKAAGIELPVEVEMFFGGEDPTNMPGREVNILDWRAVKAYTTQSRDGFEIDIHHPDLTNIKAIRVFNSY